MDRIYLVLLCFGWTTICRADEFVSELHYRARDVEHAINIKTMATEETATALSDVFNPFEGELPQSICYLGSSQKLCDLLQAMSEFSHELYKRGDHGLATLESCSVIDKTHTIRARVLLEDDYATTPTPVTSDIARCDLR